jgi:hypothetical protein
MVNWPGYKSVGLGFIIIYPKLKTFKSSIRMIIGKYKMLRSERRRIPDAKNYIFISVIHYLYVFNGYGFG